MRTMRLDFFFRFLVAAVAVQFLQSVPLLAQLGERPLKFEHLTVMQGLSQGSVHCTLQDRQGLMWFGTGDGLNKYDGYSFTVYKHENADSTSLSADWVLSIHEDRAGTLWIGTFNGGLNRFERATESFTRFVHDPQNPRSLSDNKVNAIYEDHAGALWIGTEHGLNQFDRATQTFTRFLPDSLNPRTSLSHPTICAIYEDRSHTLWIGTEGGGLNRFDPDTKQFTRFVHDPNDPQSLSDNIVRAIYEDRAGRLWIGTGRGGLNRFDRDTKTFIRFPYDPDLALPSLSYKEKAGRALNHPEVRTICEDRLGKLWLGTLGGGLNIFDPASGQFTHYVNDPKNPNSLSNNRVFSIRTDSVSRNTLWIGTDDGLNKLDRDAAPFTALTNEMENPKNSSHNIIWAICKDRRGVLWIGTENGLFRRWRDETGQEQTTYFVNHPKDPNDSENKINVIYEDSHRAGIWFGMDRGLMQFVYSDFPAKEKSGQFRRWADDAQNSSELSRLQIFSICDDSTTRNSLWIGTNSGLFRLRRKEDGPNQISVFKHDPQKSASLSSNNIRPLYVDRSGTLWVGTWHDGLNQFDEASGQFRRFVHEPQNPRSLSNNVIRSIYEDRAGRLWIGTDGGLNQFDRTSKQFTHYTEKDGLPNNAIWGILEDSRGRLWLSTNNGISCFDASAGSAHASIPSTSGTFKNYTISDGLSHQEFNRGAWFKSPVSRGGEMFFGRMNGVTAFHPDSIKDNPFIPPVVITAFKRYNTDEVEGVAIVEKGIFAKQEIKLSYKDNILVFEFAALNFRHPEKNQYAYKLEGYSEQWIQLGTKREATFTNLNPGEYVLRVKGSNNDGVWNEAGALLRIIITPPWWKTIWFRILSAAALIGLVFSAYRLRVASIQARNRALEKEIIERQQAEKKFRGVLESAPDAMIISNAEGKILLVNSRAEELFHYARQELIDQRVEILVPERWRDQHVQQRYGFQANSDMKSRLLPAGRELTGLRRDGSEIPVEITLRPVETQEGEWVIAAVRDITERKKAEATLQQAFTEIAQLKEQLQAENIYLQEEIKLEHNYEEIIGESEALKYVLHKVDQVAPNDTTVLLLGETGVGKELFARALHNISPYRERPLVKVNCAALPQHLIESELFGHEKGAFTGAVEKQIGRFELADGATIFLDEIGELPLELQPKLLRVLQDGEFERLGNPKTLKVKTRVIAATNRDLDEEVRAGRFRKDLYYRLSVYPITVPALRERRQDIPLFVRAFVERFNKKLGKSVDTIPQKTMQALQQYAWPGNVRELLNVIERAVVTARDTTLRIELPVPANAAIAGLKTLEEMEREHILKTLEATQWKIEGAEGAAARLGLNPSTLRSRMNKLGIRRA